MLHTQPDVRILCKDAIMNSRIRPVLVMSTGFFGRMGQLVENFLEAAIGANFLSELQWDNRAETTRTDHW
jgi:hypothetical protein